MNASSMCGIFHNYVLFIELFLTLFIVHIS